ncbi:hypothetical protein JCM11251_004177 [Rhodosporidiobolus azoricus]
MAGHGPLRLDHSSNVYYTVTVSPFSSAPPSSGSTPAPPPSPPALPPSLAQAGVSYIGRVGPGNMANELVYALPRAGPMAGEGSSGQDEEQVKAALKRMEGVKEVEIMQAKTRAKR